MSVTLSTLFTTPQDMWDLLSSEGVDLRLDDHNQASGQTITASSDAVVGTTSLSVSATPVALLRGATLTFDGANMEAPVATTLTAAANLGATSLTVAALTAAINGGATAQDSGVNAATAARLVVGCRKGTSRVKLYCNARYEDSQLVLCGTVNDWATTCGARWLCGRRAQGIPKTIQADYEETIEEMRMVQAGQLSLEDIGTRGVDWPTVTNVIVDPTKDIMRARVQTNISEGTPTDYNQYIDWSSALVLEW